MPQHVASELAPIGVLPAAFSEATTDIVIPLPWTTDAVTTWAPLVRVRAGVPPATASLALEWKRPRRALELVAQRHLFPTLSEPTLVVRTPFPPEEIASLEALVASLAAKLR